MSTNVLSFYTPHPPDLAFPQKHFCLAKTYDIPSPFSGSWGNWVCFLRTWITVVRIMEVVLGMFPCPRGMPHLWDVGNRHLELNNRWKATGSQAVPPIDSNEPATLVTNTHFATAPLRFNSHGFLIINHQGNFNW